MTRSTLLPLLAIATLAACASPDERGDEGRAQSAQEVAAEREGADVSPAQAALDAYYADPEWRSSPLATLEASAPLGEWRALSILGVSQLVGSRYSQNQRETPNPYRTFCFPLAATGYARAFAAAHPERAAEVHDVTGEWIATHGVQSSVRMLEQLPSPCGTSVDGCAGGVVSLDDVRYEARPLTEAGLEALPAGEPLLVVGRPLDRGRVGHWVLVLKDDSGAIRVHQQAPLSYVTLRNASQGGGAFVATYASASEAHDYLAGMARFIGYGEPTLLMDVRASHSSP